MAETAARLCKADLVTGMVGEFPELQGIIGGYLARAQGHPDAVADAIRDHYKPVGQGDELPTAPVTVAVSLADKLDTIAAFLSIGEKPTGSKDPFALRRAAIAVIRLVVENGIRTGLHRTLVEATYRQPFGAFQDPTLQANEAFAQLSRYIRMGRDVATNFYSQVRNQADQKAVERAQRNTEKLYDLADEGLDFFADRLKVQQREAGVRHDLIDAVFALGGEDDLVRLLARVKALQAFVETAEGADLLAGTKRAANILKKEGWGQGKEQEPVGHPSQKQLSYTPESEEAALIAALDSAEPKARAAVEAEDFEGAMAALASLRAPVDAFFDKVTVNDADPVKRAARLDLLLRMRNAVHQVADFSKIEG